VYVQSPADTQFELLAVLPPYVSQAVASVAVHASATNALYAVYEQPP